MENIVVVIQEAAGGVRDSDIEEDDGIMNERGRQLTMKLRELQMKKQHMESLVRLCAYKNNSLSFSCLFTANVIYNGVSPRACINEHFYSFVFPLGVRVSKVANGRTHGQRAQPLFQLWGRKLGRGADSQVQQVHWQQ